jgi:curli production assembly/transport component CsgE
MSLTKRLLLAPMLWLACAGMQAAAQQAVEGDLRADAAGIVTSRAITVAGHEFASYFIAAWRDKPDSERYALAIHERPSARLGSQVRIEFAQRPVFQVRLPPSRAALKALGENAAELTYQAVMAADAERVLIDDVDLARDEF